MDFTLAQDVFDAANDYIERDEDGKLIGMWADYFKEKNLPTTDIDHIVPSLEADGNYGEITYAGLKPLVKVNGSYKTLNIAYYNSGELIKDQSCGDWSYFIGEEEVDDLIQSTTSDEKPNQIKIKFLGDESYLNKVLTVVNTRNDIVTKLNLEIVSL